MFYLFHTFKCMEYIRVKNAQHAIVRMLINIVPYIWMYGIIGRIYMKIWVVPMSGNERGMEFLRMARSSNGLEVFVFFALSKKVTVHRFIKNWMTFRRPSCWREFVSACWHTCGFDPLHSLRFFADAKPFPSIGQAGSSVLHFPSLRRMPRPCPNALRGRLKKMRLPFAWTHQSYRRWFFPSGRCEPHCLRCK